MEGIFWISGEPHVLLTEKTCLWSHDKWHYLIEGTGNAPTLPDQIGQTDTLGNRQSLKKICHVRLLSNDQHLELNQETN